MKEYIIKYYYLATGMEGLADEQYFSTWAESKEQALDQVAKALYEQSKSKDPTLISWIRGCLSIIEQPQIRITPI